MRAFQDPPLLLPRSRGREMHSTLRSPALVEMALQKRRGDRADVEVPVSQDGFDPPQAALIVGDDVRAPDRAQFHSPYPQVCADSEGMLQVLGDLVGDNAQPHRFAPPTLWSPAHTALRPPRREPANTVLLNALPPSSALTIERSSEWVE